MANALDLLYAKISDPIGAALGAYALLRLGRLDKLDEHEDWVRNLADWFPALPDGAVSPPSGLARRGGRASEAERLAARGGAARPADVRRRPLAAGHRVLQPHARSER